jgi:hypothetical protein
MRVNQPIVQCKTKLLLLHYDPPGLLLPRPAGVLVVVPILVLSARVAGAAVTRNSPATADL